MRSTFGTDTAFQLTLQDKMLFLVLTAILALVSLPTPSASQGDNTLPLTIPVRVTNTNEQVCPSDEVLEMELDEINQDVRNMIRNTVIPALCLLGQTQASPVASCSALFANCPSDYYWVGSSNGTAVQVYCDMDRVCGCNSTGGWTRVANLNMSNPSEQCPGDFNLQTYSTAPMRLCGGANIGTGCVSAVYSTYGISYSHVCGRVIGYQYGGPDGFSAANQNPSVTIDGIYLDGVSLTHGSPGARQHIWSFACGLFETNTPPNTQARLYCPCVSGAAVPSYVENNYFCESGNQGTSVNRGVLFPSDPLWDGQGCGSPPCCELSTAPWFCRQLPQTTTDDIEVRICRNEPPGDEDTPVELIELYIR